MMIQRMGWVLDSDPHLLRSVEMMVCHWGYMGGGILVDAAKVIVGSPHWNEQSPARMNI